MKKPVGIVIAFSVLVLAFAISLSLEHVAGTGHQKREFERNKGSSTLTVSPIPSPDPAARDAFLRTCFEGVALLALGFMVFVIVILTRRVESTESAYYTREQHDVLRTSENDVLAAIADKGKVLAKRESNIKNIYFLLKAAATVYGARDKPGNKNLDTQEDMDFTIMLFTVMAIWLAAFSMLDLLDDYARANHRLTASRNRFEADLNNFAGVQATKDDLLAVEVPIAHYENVRGNNPPRWYNRAVGILTRLAKVAVELFAISRVIDLVIGVSSNMGII